MGGDAAHRYGLTARVDAGFDVAVDAVRSALADQGFGVLTEIDVEQIMRTKLGEEVGPYLILGACNPPLAHRAIVAEPSIGLLLPCNVVVRAPDSNGTVVEALDPAMMVTMTGNQALEPVSAEAARRLEAAMAAVATQLRTPGETTAP